jgi:hypothetical protein
MHEAATKTLGSRREDGELVAELRTLQRTMNRLRGRALVPRGLYRFRSHEEADRWMMREIASTHARQSSKTSSPSAEPSNVKASVSS